MRSGSSMKLGSLDWVVDTNSSFQQNTFRRRIIHGIIRMCRLLTISTNTGDGVLKGCLCTWLLLRSKVHQT